MSIPENESNKSNLQDNNPANKDINNDSTEEKDSFDIGIDLSNIEQIRSYLFGEKK